MREGGATPISIERVEAPVVGQCEPAAFITSGENVGSFADFIKNFGPRPDVAFWHSDEAIDTTGREVRRGD